MNGTPRTRLMTLLATLLLGGCASTSIEGNYREVRQFGIDRLGAETRWLASADARAEMSKAVDRMLDEPLSLDAAEHIALGYSPAFQIVLAEVAAESADATQSARIANPIFTFEKLVRNEDGERDLDIGRSLGFSLLDILLLPARLERAEFRQQQLRLRASAELVGKLGEARQAWVGAVAAQQAANYQTQALEVAEAGAELARRMQSVGNFSRLQRAREQVAYANAAANLARARQQALAAREHLVRVLGLTAAQATRLAIPEHLPPLPAAIGAEEAFARQAFQDRLDLRMARAELDWTATTLGLTRVTSVVDGLHLAAVQNSETGAPEQRGYEIELPLPIFDFGDARRASAQARYMATLNATAQAAVVAASELREAYAGYRSAWHLARHYREELVPLRERISEELLLRYNGMLTGVFELLADARVRVSVITAAIEAERDAWLAHVALQGAMLGRPARLPTMQAAAAAPEAGGGH